MDRLQHLEALRSVLASVRPGLDMPSSDAGESGRQRALRRLDDHVLPRVASIQAPLLAVVGGSTGSGKSTLVNSLIGQIVAEASAVRPTTRVPLLVYAPGEGPWFETMRVLPRLARISGAGAADVTAQGAGGVGAIRIQEADISTGLALLDAPDIDSVATENRLLARELLDAADLWVFVTTATRYADAVPWEILQQAATRTLDVVVVLNRVPLGAEKAITQDLRRMLEQAGLGAAPVFTIAEQSLVDGLLPADQVQGLKSWLENLAGDGRRRARVAMRALSGAVADVVSAGYDLVSVLDQENQDIGQAEAHIDAQVHIGVEHIAQATADGTLLRGEVLARWQEVVGAADLTRKLSHGVSWVRDRIGAFVRGKPAPVQPVEDALEAGLSQVIREELLRVTEEVERTWAESSATRQLPVPPPNTQQATRLAAELTREWQRDLLAMVRSQGATRRTSARIAAIGVNVVGVALMVVIFAQTGGLTGAEVGVAGATAAVAQSVLEAIFGDQAVRLMAKTARELLVKRARQSLDDQVQPLRVLLPPRHQTEDLEAVLDIVRADWGVR